MQIMPCSYHTGFPFDRIHISRRADIMNQIYNPYMPNFEYVPDGEPHVFENRLYVYGSHDCFGKFPFCHNSYVTYSAPVDDLTSWRYEGVIYPKKNDDPLSKNGRSDFYAPDVAKGNDGNYYLFYSYAWSSIISVCVSSSPKGPFIYLGHVHDASGKEYGMRKGDPFAFDPAIFVDDDGRIYLYSGFGAKTFFPQIPHGHKPQGSFVMELENDMLTIKGEPKPLSILDNEGKMGFDHSFFEASSMRKFFNQYYFIYSSQAGHELCYATSSSPMGPFTYQGVLISNGDVGYKGRKKPLYPLGNNHGSLVKVHDDYFIFYHRHTNYTNTDRQAMAERIIPDEKGLFPQVEKTSQGLNRVPLLGKGEYPSSICSSLVPKEGNVFYPFFRPPFYSLTKTYITQAKKDNEKEETQYIHNVQDGLVIAYKYFDLSKTSRIHLHLKGRFKGSVSLSFDEREGKVSTTLFELKGEDKIPLDIPHGRDGSALYLYFSGKGKCDFLSFDFEE